MANYRTLQQSFAGGEIGEDMYSRVEDGKYRSGAARVRNMIVRPTGTVASRPGFQYVATVKDSTKATRLIAFRQDSGTTVHVEVGEGYFRFHKEGGTIELASTPGDYKPNKPFTQSSVATPIASYNPGTGEFQTSAAHGLSNNQLVYLTDGTGTLPSTFAGGVAYYVSVVDATHFLLDNVTPFVAAITGGGALVATALIWTQGASDVITFATAHGFADNDPIVFTIDSGSALPSPLGVGSTYYADTAGLPSPTTQLRIKGSPTTPTYTLATAGTYGGSFRMQHAYEPRDLARYGGVNYYCVQNPTINGSAQKVPGTDAAYWHALTGDIYEIPNDYLAGDLFALTHDQNNDVMALASGYYALGELRRYGDTSWQFIRPTLSGSVAPPTGVSVTGAAGINLTITAATTGGGNISLLTTSADHRLGAGDVIYLSGLTNTTPGTFCTAGYYSVGSAPSTTTFVPVQKDGATGVAATGTYSSNSGRVAYVGSSEDATNYYVVTAIGADGRESVASAAGNATNNLFVRDAYNTITWVASTTAGVQRYHIYKRSNGLYGYLGQVDANEALSFVDDNIDPDLGRSPPILDDSLDTDYPAAVAHFEQRRILAGTVASPQQVWGTRSGTESDLAYHIPVQDDDRISFAIASREPAGIKHIVPVSQLLLLTESGEYRVTPVNSDAITPTSIAVRAQSYIGTTHVAPLIVNTTVLFCAARGGHVRELGFSAEVDSYLTGDVSIRASHLFDGFEITSSALCKAPYPIAWFTSDNGKLLGLTYVPEEGVGAWHWHDTDGVIECVSAGPEGSEDRVYVIVRRTLDGQTVRTIERMGSMAAPDALEDAFCVDCGLTYDGAAATTISGLSHLAGEAVSVLADGRVVTGKTVSASGTITLSTAASVVHVGLPYTCDLQTLPIAVQVEAFSHGRTKNVNRVWLRCTSSGAFDVGPDTSRLRSSDPRGENAGSYMSGQIPVPVDGKWTDDGQVWLRQSDPLPVTVVGQVVEVSIGG